MRELRNIVEHALSLGENHIPALTPPSMRPAAVGSSTPPATTQRVLDMPFKEAKGMLVESFEREYLTHLLAKHRGNISRAAQEAGIDRNYIHRLVKKYNIPVIRGSEAD